MSNNPESEMTISFSRLKEIENTLREIKVELRQLDEVPESIKYQIFELRADLLTSVCSTDWDEIESPIAPGQSLGSPELPGHETKGMDV
jgi:hypothetical protein